MSSKSRNPIPSDLRSFHALVEVVAALRGPDGCPWDKEQTHPSLVKYAIEEVCEYAEAVEKGDPTLMREELGDVLFQVILNSQIAKEAGQFDLKDVIETLNTKMISRHPHVFGDTQVGSAEEVVKNWELQKKKEKKTVSGQAPTTFGLPKELSSLHTAQKIGKKTERTGFDWSNPEQVLAKVREEIMELEEACKNLDQSGPVEHGNDTYADARRELENELGDVLFSLAQFARHMKIDTEQVLRRTNLRFEKRYFHMVTKVGSEEKFKNLPDAEKELLWHQAKEATGSSD